jgi:CO dehydrogenase maturation factor
MKIAVAGKGGVGKTFVAGTLARLFSRDGYSVLAVDADPDINLFSTLGIERNTVEKVVPLSENDSLIASRTGVTPDASYGQLFKLTPRVDDIVDKFGVTGPDGVRLLIMGTVKGGGTGCMCPANALLRVLLQHLLIQRGEIVVLDMVAGLEHLGRGTARRVDAMLSVTEPSMKSVETTRRVVALAREIEIPEVLAVGNKIEKEQDRLFVEKAMKELGITVAAYIPYDQAISEADMKGVSPLDHGASSSAIKAVAELKEDLKKRYSI